MSIRDIRCDITCMTMDEIFDKAMEQDWTLETLQAWTIFKIAQFLEKITQERRG